MYLQLNYTYLLSRLYEDSSDPKDPFRAVVTWLCRPPELPKQVFAVAVAVAVNVAVALFQGGGWSTITFFPNIRK